MAARKKKAPRPTRPSAFEREVLDVVLLELRRAMRMRGQLSLTIDPFGIGDGAHIFASPNTEGRTYTVEKRRGR